MLCEKSELLSSIRKLITWSNQLTPIFNAVKIAKSEKFYELFIN